MACFERYAYLPGENSTKFEMVVNLATANSLASSFRLRLSPGPRK